MNLGPISGGGVLGAIRQLNSIQLQKAQALQKLSTGERINRGADDPAGLISSEQLRGVLAALDGISASLQRTSAVANTADAALGEVSDLLIDAKGIEVSLANGSFMSDDEKAILQDQLDGILSSVDRISQSTTFNGQNLLDGTATLTAGRDALPIDSVAPAHLGETNIDGATHTLADVGAAGDLADNPQAASTVIDAAISQVAQMRGSIGAFDANILQTRVNSLSVATEEITQAQSMIRDTDFALEFSNLARLSILEQSSTRSIGLLLAVNRSAMLDLFDVL